MDDMWEPTGAPPPPPPPSTWPPASPDWPPPGPPGEPPSRPDVLRPLIALAAVAALVLAVGLAVVLSGGDDEVVSVDPGTTQQPVPPTAGPTLTTSPQPMPSTTTSTPTTTSTSTSSTSTTTPLAPVAAAGDDLVVSAAVDVELAALDLSEANQSVVWRQTAGPDVTDGRGRLLGATVTFRSPGRPATLHFDLVVTGRGGDVARDDLRIDVLQEAGNALFVDGVDGDDGGDGSRDRPFRSLGRALAAAGGGADVYLRSFDGVYDAAGRTVPGGTSIFGGYDEGWERDVDARAGVGPLRVAGGGVTILSALEVAAAGGGGDVEALSAVGAGRLIVELSRVEAGSSSSGHSVGVRVDGAGEVLLVESEVRSGDAGDGADGATADVMADTGVDGLSAGGRPGGAGGGTGGRGGDGGIGPNVGGDGGPSGSGGAGGLPGQDGEPGPGAGGGVGGAGGDGGSGFLGADPTGAAGRTGSVGADGRGGRGGGGGGGLVGQDGGGGGGGGGGGRGGAGGGGGAGGHGSVGILLVDVDRVVIRDSVIEAGSGGDGGAGAPGSAGGQGGDGGAGADGVSTFLATAGSGGGGGGGGAGGEGGHGGGGAGGVSIGLLTSNVGEVEVAGSRIAGGTGGHGGDGGRGGVRGADGAGGDGRGGGPGGVGVAPDGARGQPGRGATGGDSIGWWDDGAARTVRDATIVAGTPGAPDGRAVDLAT